MEPVPPPSEPRTRAVDLGLAAAGVAVGLLTLGLQRSVDDASWREVFAIAEPTT